MSIKCEYGGPLVDCTQDAEWSEEHGRSFCKTHLSLRRYLDTTLPRERIKAQQAAL